MPDWSSERTRLKLGDALLTHNALLTVVVDENWEILFASGAIEYVSGYKSSTELIGRSALDFAHPDDVEIALAGIATAERMGPDNESAHIIGPAVAVRMIRADGQAATVSISAANLLEHPDIQGIALRIQLAEGQARVDEFVHRLATGAASAFTLQPLADGLASAFPDSGFALGLVGGDGEPVVVAAGLDDRWVEALRAPLGDGRFAFQGLTSQIGDTVVLEAENITDELAALSASDEVHQVWGHSIAAQEPAREVSGSIVVVRFTPDELLFNHRQSLERTGQFLAVSAHQWEQDRLLRHAAESDELTGVANRSRFRDVLGRLSTARQPFALLYLDLDDFKPINDKYGHEVGDEVLRAVGARLRGCARGSDLVARLGGDEFAVVTTDLNDSDGLSKLQRRVEDALMKPLRTNDIELCTSASIGVALSQDHDSIAEVVRAADRAMYRAKRHRKS